MKPNYQYTSKFLFGNLFESKKVPSLWNMWQLIEQEEQEEIEVRLEQCEKKIEMEMTNYIF